MIIARLKSYDYYCCLWNSLLRLTPTSCGLCARTYQAIQIIIHSAAHLDFIVDSFSAIFARKCSGSREFIWFSLRTEWIKRWIHSWISHHRWLDSDKHTSAQCRYQFVYAAQCRESNELIKVMWLLDASQDKLLWEQWHVQRKYMTNNGITIRINQNHTFASQTMRRILMNFGFWYDYPEHLDIVRCIELSFKSNAVWLIFVRSKMMTVIIFWFYFSYAFILAMVFYAIDRHRISFAYKSRQNYLRALINNINFLFEMRFIHERNEFMIRG